MKALTIRQPWASQIMAGGKTVENRTWKPSEATLARLPRRIAVHSAKNYAGGIAPALMDGPRGAVLGTVEIVAVHSAWTVGNLERRCCDEPGAEHHVSIPSPGAALWHWVLRDPIRLTVPVECPGRQGLWEVPEPIERLLAGGR